MFTLEDYLVSFIGTLIPHAVLAVYLFVIMGTRGRRVLKKLPALLLSPLFLLTCWPKTVQPMSSTKSTSSSPLA